MALLWPDHEKPFKYTRGILLGDRDKGIFDEDKKVIEADRCVLCRYNESGAIMASDDEIKQSLDGDDPQFLIDIAGNKTINSNMPGTLTLQFDSNKC